MKLRTLEQHDALKAEAYRISGLPKKNGIACPSCGKELFDTSPAVVLPSAPPRKYIHCETCDFKGTALA